MSLIFDFITTTGIVFLGIYLAIVSSPNKLIIWILWGIIFISNVCKLVINIREREKRKKKEKKDETKEDYYQIKAERRELIDRDLLMEYIDGLGDHPELQHYLNSAEKLEDENKYNEAIEEYKKCLSHPRATNDNKVAANILMGNCYYNISQLTEAKNNYRQALIISKKVKDKNKRLIGKASCLGNIGLIYSAKGGSDEALKYHKDALKIHRKIGDKLKEANQLGDIGLIYSDKEEPDEALKYLEDALNMYREIEYKKGEANQLGNIGLIYLAKGESDEALKYLEDALNIFDKYNLQRGRKIIQKAVDDIKKQK